MGKKPERLLDEMRRSKVGRKISELDSLLRGFGFTTKESAKHCLYLHPEHPDLFVTVTRSSRELDAGYVRSAIDAIDRLIARRNEA